MDKVFVIGSGLMGSGIAQVCAQVGLRVVLCGRSELSLQQGLDSIAWSLGKLRARHALEHEPDHYLGLIKTTGDYAAASDADIAMEAVVEDKAIKLKVLGEVETFLKDGALLASTTSAIPISRLAQRLARPQDFFGLHFFSPVPMIKGVEVIQGKHTSLETFDAGADLVRRLGKEPISVTRDQPGFLINRINYPSLLEAMHLVESGAATVEEIDKGMRLCLGRKRGIFETSDMVGIDVTYAALSNMYQNTEDPRWRPPAIMRGKVEQGHWGRKTGRGWYGYDDDED